MDTEVDTQVDAVAAPIETVQQGRHQVKDALAQAHRLLMGEAGLTQDAQVDRLNQVEALLADAVTATQATRTLAEARNFEAHQDAKHGVPQDSETVDA